MKKQTHDFLNPKNVFIKFEPGYNYRIFIPEKTFEGLSEQEIKLVEIISEVQKLDAMFVIDFLKTEGSLTAKKFKLKK
ncbi:MAG: hypothetical protein LDL01_02975 [Ignavibacterium sp.]|uniref:Uncharacterized protein n=1 Tax=Ignavibacterium album TaxID=591197 RepID=A0A7V3E7G8_9BACT|nr:hypothetical protein [Ignavibacterium album]MCA2004736.1 hypothetical protein [Ignavibacterium sp.]MCX8105506.1 hypothetical protein [Ignavibacterium album]